MSIRVLFVESDLVLVELLTAWLGERGMEVVGRVDSMEGALEACEKREPHLVLLALRVLPFSTEELLKQMGARWPSMQVLVSSFWATGEEVRGAKWRGAQGGFSRPPSLEGFEEALGACSWERPERG
ncbi:MAG: response regulator [Cystobacterineae bacterium]|nr:response regulator [Cystobacterineae bacterium]